MSLGVNKGVFIVVLVFLLGISSAAAAPYGTVSPTTANVVSTPSADAKNPVLETLKQGDQVGLGVTQNGFYYVRTRKGTIGWIAADALITSDATRALTTSEGSRSPASYVETTYASPTRTRDFGFGISVGVPHPLEITLEKRFGLAWDLAIGAGWLSIPFDINGDPATATNLNFDARIRWRPWKGSFFVGLMSGWKKLSGSWTLPITVATETFKFTLNEDISSLFVSPHIGWLWVWSSGFSFGLELGWYFPFSVKSGLTTSTEGSLANVGLAVLQQTDIYANAEATFNNAATLAGSTSIPYVTLIHVGWYF